MDTSFGEFERALRKLVDQYNQRRHGHGPSGLGSSNLSSELGGAVGDLCDAFRALHVPELQVDGEHSTSIRIHDNNGVFSVDVGHRSGVLRVYTCRRVTCRRTSQLTACPI
jgi:hypothetical protein